MFIQGNSNMIGKNFVMIHVSNKPSNQNAEKQRRYML